MIQRPVGRKANAVSAKTSDHRSIGPVGRSGGRRLRQVNQANEAGSLYPDSRISKSVGRGVFRGE